VESAEQRLGELGIELPEPSPSPNYLPTKRHGDLVFLAGHGPSKLDGTGSVTGKVGREVSTEEAREAARLTGLHMLASLRAEIGSLDHVRSILHVLGMVNCAPGFNDTPAVINGCSELFVDVLGEEVGRHTRAAVGMAELPYDICVEIEMQVAVAPD
jgi:enamine deaminase RidA (YjgF/YER057c/UK114 family)